MPFRRGAIRRQQAADELADEMDHWKRFVNRLPAVRLEKVMASREALRRNGYDSEHILVETIARLGDDIGIPDSQEERKERESSQ